MSVMELEIEPERSPEFAAARERALKALQDAQHAVQAMIESLGPVEAHHDDVADLIQVSQLCQELAATVKLDVQGEGGFVLSWLLQNSGGIREVRCGDLKYWGEKEKSTHCIDVGEAGLALAQIRLGPHMADVVALAVTEGEEGDRQGREAFWGVTRDFFREVVSANGLKEGACRKILATEAETLLRLEFDLNSVAVEPLMGEAPEQALERAVEAAREAAYLEHWTEVWPDKLAGGEPRTKLGVGNMRFLYRRGGGTKKDFEEMERKRLSAGGDA